jgi:hypothetical protein
LKVIQKIFRVFQKSTCDLCHYERLKTRFKETIHKAFSHRNYGSKCVVLGYNSTYFSNKIQKGKTYYSEEQVISMLEFLIDNIFSCGRVVYRVEKSKVLMEDT